MDLKTLKTVVCLFGFVFILCPGSIFSGKVLTFKVSFCTPYGPTQCYIQQKVTIITFYFWHEFMFIQSLPSFMKVREVMTFLLVHHAEGNFSITLCNAQSLMSCPLLTISDYRIWVFINKQVWNIHEGVNSI